MAGWEGRGDVVGGEEWGGHDDSAGGRGSAGMRFGRNGEK